MHVAFIHPDLGIGGAERLVVDAALGLQKLGHSVDIYTSHHDPGHCFQETKDGSLKVHHVNPPFPRAISGKWHILLAHLRQIHLTVHILWPFRPKYDVFFVDQLSTCVPFLRIFGGTRVVFYCHFPDKLLANGEFVDGNLHKKSVGLLKRVYRYPMDWLEEVTTRQADIILANSKFTARVFTSYFKTIRVSPRVVYPGINVSAYEAKFDASDPDVMQVVSDNPTLLSLNRFEKKKNTALAIDSFALLRKSLSGQSDAKRLRLVIAGGYDPRLEDNMMTLVHLIDRVNAASLSFNIVVPSSSAVKIPPFNTNATNPDVLFVLNFTTSQRSALLYASSTMALLYTPTNEHFGIGPVEGMLAGVPVLACNTGGPTESVVDDPPYERTGWLCPPDKQLWCSALQEVLALSPEDRREMAERSKRRAKNSFGMDAMAKNLQESLEEAVKMGSVCPEALWVGSVLLLIMVIIAVTRPAGMT